MPEELAVALVILGVAAWLIVKVVQAVASAIGNTQKTATQAILRRNEARRIERKGELSRHVKVFLPDQLERAEKELDAAVARVGQLQAATRREAARPPWTRKEFRQYGFPPEDEAYGGIYAEDIQSILRPNSKTWANEEAELIAQECRYPFDPPISGRLEYKPVPASQLELDVAVLECDRSVVDDKQIAEDFAGEQSAVSEYNRRRLTLVARQDELNKQIRELNERLRLDWEAYYKKTELLTKEEFAAFKMASELYVATCKEQKRRFKTMLDGHRNGVKKDVINRMTYVLGSLTIPRSVPRTWDLDFDDEQGILVVEIGLPDVVHKPSFKTVLLKKGPVRKPLNQSERKEIIPRIHPAILLRVAYEVFRNDDAETVRLLVVNGWVRFDDPSTGVDTKAYTASLMVERAQIANLNLSKIDPLVAFDSLHGKSAGKLVEIIPIEPTLSLNRQDSRFVDAKAVLNTLGNATNLAAMDWQDFEHLIRELFEKEFSGRGAEVKITQASRDRGVDAIVFDPDPIHGGKYVIQAKRYTNTVDVSAVRDLCAVVKKEGASRGILVTTSSFGADAYGFANNEPVTLLNGAELLGLLVKHGYSFRINLQEARRLASGGTRERSSD